MAHMTVCHMVRVLCHVWYVTEGWGAVSYIVCLRVGVLCVTWYVMGWGCCVIYHMSQSEGAVSHMERHRVELNFYS